jgi:DNA-binding NtrC family response regulator
MSAAGTRVLVLEDDKALSEILCEELGARGFRPMPTESVAEAVEHLGRFEFDVAILDLMLPDGSGIDVLRHLTEERLATEAIVLTGYAQVSTALEAMKLGAYDYLSKPVRMDELEALVLKAAEKASLRRENLSLRLRLELQRAPTGIITEDPGMHALLATLDKVAQSDLSVLIQGESGTGKELVARALHERSERASLPFVAFNCAAVPDNLIESEMFGYEKGAFTGATVRKPGLFELADHGVLFLDEIGDLSPAVQVKLLRAVEIREFYRVGGTRAVRLDVRIVSATNRNLKEASASGGFREDLYFRLNGVTLQLPPLRDRKGDIALLAAHFLKKPGTKPRSLSHAAVQKLEAYPWPGNIRELQMVMRRAAVLATRETLEPDDLPLEAKSSS